VRSRSPVLARATYSGGSSSPASPGSPIGNPVAAELWPIQLIVVKGGVPSGVRAGRLSTVSSSSASTSGVDSGVDGRETSMLRVDWERPDLHDNLL
jgi:hypothetical protein